MATYNGMTEAQEELQRIREYKEIYEETNPLPEEPVYEVFDEADYSYKSIMGASAVGFRLASWGSIGYSAIRTAGVFAQIVAVELTNNNWNSLVVSSLTFVSAFCILGAVEGFLYAYGQEKGRESGKLSVSLWGALAALLMSGFAGLLPSLDLLPESPAATNVINFVRWVLAFVSGLGVIPLVIYGAENLGVLDTKWRVYLEERRNEIQARNEILRTEYEAKMADWNNGLQGDYRKIGRSALFGEGKFVATRKSKSSSQEQEDKRNYTEEIREWMKQNGYTPYDVGKDGRVTPVQIADELQFPKGSSARRNTSTIIGRLKDEYDAGNW